ncbi:MAG: WxL protein peptidoglycan domain-containing protein, partial [Bombilactobacillus sp.]
MKNCQKLISIGFLTFFGILALFLPLTKVNAGNQMANFEVIPNFPTNQNPKTGKGYFDLLVKPGQVQPLSITLVNNSDQAKKIRIMATDAKTTPTIDVSYDNSVKIKDDSLKFSFAKFGFTPKTVNLKAKSKLNVPLNFK